MELWELYDKNHCKTGIVHERAKAKEIPDGLYHLVVVGITINPEQKILLTQRVANKPMGGMWECTGGSVVLGEESVDGMIRELNEGTGLEVDESKLEFITTVLSDEYKTMYDMYVFRVDENDPKLHLQIEEVSDEKWVSVDEFYQMADAGLIDEGWFERCKRVLRMVNMNRG